MSFCFHRSNRILREFRTDLIGFGGVNKKYGLPEQSQPSSSKCEHTAAASCICSWRVCTQCNQEPHDLPSGDAGFGSVPLPSNAPGEKVK